MNAKIVKKIMPPLDGMLNIDTLHLSVGITIPYSVYRGWKKGKGDSRIKKVKSELGNLDLIYYNNNYNSTLIVELSVAKFLYGSNAHPFTWSRLPEVAARIQCVVGNEIGISDIDIYDFYIKRLDLNVDHIYSSDYKANKQITLMDKYYYSPSPNYKTTYKGTRYLYSCKAGAKVNTINKAGVFKYYRKDQETKYRYKKGKAPKTELLENPCIRYELTLPDKKIAEIFSKKHISLRDIIYCDPIKLWKCGLRKIGSNLELKIMDKDTFAYQKKNITNNHKSRSKIAKKFFDAIISKDIAYINKHKAIIAELAKTGYQSIYDSGFRNYQTPNILH